MVATNQDPNTDMFGYPVFMGAHVITGVAGDYNNLRYGTVTAFKEATNEVKISGGNCGRPIWRHPKDLAVLLLLTEMKNAK